MTVQEELDAKQAEYEKLSAQIAKLESGPVRVELKRLRNSLTGAMVVLRQKLIKEQIDIALAGGAAKNVPRLTFEK